jgi:hypothetical protein
LQKGLAWPVPRFTDNGDGTVRDNLTDLLWLKNANCFEGRIYANALSVSNNLADGECGLSDGSVPGDWRLPNVRELQSPVDYSQTYPALPAGHPFTGFPSTSVPYYWSSTTHTLDAGDVWIVNMDDGRVYYYPNNYYLIVWPVRGGN